jgi:hypothetical protein
MAFFSGAFEIAIKGQVVGESLCNALDVYFECLHADLAAISASFLWPQCRMNVACERCMRLDYFVCHEKVFVRINVVRSLSNVFNVAFEFEFRLPLFSTSFVIPLRN